MNIIYYAFTLVLLLANVAGISLYLRHWLPSYALARAAGVLLLCSVAFFCEHFAGFGTLTWVWPLTTSIALLKGYQVSKSTVWREFLRAEGVFLLAFFYGFAWKWTFPIIYPTSERVTDLYFIGNYLPGQTLPPLDNWFPPHRFDFYYAFQHYAAALMGRVLGLGPGLTYNVAFALILALSITLAWEFTATLLRQSWKRCLVVMTLVVGGTGATPFVHLTYSPPSESTDNEQVALVSDAMWASQRFIGSFDQRLNTDLGHTLFPRPAKPGWEPLDLPLEGFGYQYYVGDYHPPLGGFLLLMLALACIARLEHGRNRHCTGQDAWEDGATAVNDNDTPEQRQNLQRLLAFTVPMMIAINTWAFPLQTALLTGWIVWRYVHKRPPDLKAMLTGMGSGFVLLYPFLTGFASNAIPTPIKWVQPQDHTPLLGFISMHWPLLLFAGLSCFAKGTRRLTLLYSVVFLGLLGVSECIFVDDPSGGKFERTNTVMKWWGWIWSGGLVALASILLASRVRWIQGVVVIALLVINVYVVDVFRYWWYTPKTSAGILAGHSVYTYDPPVREIFRYLENAPSGIVLENNYGGSFTDSGIYSAFAVKPTLLGWPMHLLTWHSSIGQAWILKDQIVQFYQGKLPDATAWLDGNQVDYIVWTHRDQQQPTAWEQINNSIGRQFGWHEFTNDANTHLGLWIRRKAA